MTKNSATIFLCSNCEAQFQKWVGRCLECGAWGTIEESQATSHISRDTKNTNIRPAETKILTDIKTDIKRILTNIGELDRVLGGHSTGSGQGGIVPGSLILLGGEPGIGKSTLALQLATSVPNTLYVSGEESVEQISMRALRLSVNQDYPLSVSNETNADTICATIKQNKPQLAIVDSIQTIFADDVAGEPGNPNQIRACTTKLLECAKTAKKESVNQDYPLSVRQASVNQDYPLSVRQASVNQDYPLSVSIVIIGHVTKDGSVAGPKMLEHLVDTVLYFEGDPHHDLRVLRATKNRFGSTDEVGIFEMTESGLKEVKNPSQYLLAERGENMPGSVVTCLIEGTRPLLVEIQALVNKTVFGYPQRKSSGFDLNRLHLLTAVLQRRAGLNLAQYDIHVNVVGGLRADEPAADLAVCLAIASAYKDKALGGDLVAFGEVGLGGEVRSVRQLERRIKECEQLGMKRVITRMRNTLSSTTLKMVDVKNIGELITHTG